MKLSKSFKDDIKRTFFSYALIPVAIIIILSLSISYTVWYRTVVGQNKDINKSVSGRIETITEAYTVKANELAVDPVTLTFLYEDKSRIPIYESIYNFTNQLDIRCDFYLFDHELFPVVSSTIGIPSYAAGENPFRRGLAKSMLDDPQNVHLARETVKDNSKTTLSIGKAIVHEGQIQGFIVFDLNESDLIRLISRDFSVNIVVTDMFNSVISSTNTLLINKFDKIDDTFKNKEGFLWSINNRYYVTRSVILNGSILIYTITTIGYFESIFMVIGIILITVFILFVFISYIGAKKIVYNKTKSIDEIIVAMRNAQNGNFNTVLNIKTDNEFQIIGETYNEMVSEIKVLLETNKEKAKQSVVSEIKQLESQFNAHFLFNTLEIIKYMSKIDPSQVKNIIVAFASLLRYSINNSISKVTLGEDLEYTKNYLLIQKYRFDENFQYHINLQEQAADCMVPKLIIQPIIENSIKYGFDLVKSLIVRIDAVFEKGKLVIRLTDNGGGIAPEKLTALNYMLQDRRGIGSHIGLFNVHRKIQLMYGDEYGLEIQSDKKMGTVVTLVLPIQRGSEDDEDTDS